VGQLLHNYYELFTYIQLLLIHLPEQMSFELLFALKFFRVECVFINTVLTEQIHCSLHFPFIPIVEILFDDLLMTTIIGRKSSA